LTMNNHLRILVTGGAGFIGSHVAREALLRGMDVTIVDNLSSGKINNIPDGVSFIKHDIRNIDWDDLLPGIDIVFHAAAFVSAPESFEFFNECFDVNVRGTWRLINACVKYKVKKFIFASSSAIYPESSLPNTENDLPNPANPYGLSKLNTEYLLEMLKTEYGFHYTALRFFNVFGPRQDVDSIYSAVIPIFITRAMQNKDLIIYGSGRQTRDFVFVKDVAEAILIFASNTIDGVFNLGTGLSYNLIELAEIILKETGSSSRIVYENPRPGDIMFSEASLEKQNKTGAWSPKIDFKDGLKETIDFYKNQQLF
jgi:UDP-glucose 4-epimerase